MNSAEETTCWSLIEGAARGGVEERSIFAARYERSIRAYLSARWRRTRLDGSIDDAVQQVFLECFKPDGVLARAEQGHRGGFRSYLQGVIRNIALVTELRGPGRFEERLPSALDLATEETPERAFERAWAECLLQEARDLMRSRADLRGPEAQRRVELLRLRFHDGLPIREIAARWGRAPAEVHRDYARARNEYREALELVVAFHRPGTREEIERACIELLVLLE